MDEYLSRLCKEQTRLIKRKGSELLHEQHLKHNRQVVAVIEFLGNSYVLVQYPPGLGRKSQPPNRLRTNLKGPIEGGSSA